MIKRNVLCVALDTIVKKWNAILVDQVLVALIMKNHIQEVITFVAIYIIMDKNLVMIIDQYHFI